ncbi:MAG: chloride channel protein, partial [Cyanobacteria bacterium]|nr:chloride channel protein [Cyanobacteriota bacterium]MDW8200186.1 chloride channel protein [Cyanobacteriota bacterium SKYGB_h_bin112]
YLGLGLLASLVSITFTQTIKLAQSCFGGQVAPLTWLGQIPRALHPIMGGAVVGITALGFPQIMGVGYETIEAILRDVEFSLPLLVILLVTKLIVTAVSSGSGLVGGIYAPALFLGSALGASYGKVLQILLPDSVSIAAPPAYAMVGMAAVLAGSVRAPLTSILLLFELTRDYRIVLPLMAAVGLSVWLVDYLKPMATGLNLQQMGVNVDRDYRQELLHQLRVEEAMQVNVLILPQTMSIVEVGQILLSYHAHSALVTDSHGRLRGIVTLQDVDRALSRIIQTTGALANSPEALVPDLPDLGTICTTDVIHTYRDESLATALDRMASRGLHQLPVVDRSNPDRIVGLLDHDNITLTCSLAATRQGLQTYQQTSYRGAIVTPVTSAEPVIAVSTQQSLQNAS